jgi:hypothetical protein
MFYKERKFTFKDLWISKQDLRSSDLWLLRWTKIQYPCF